LPAADSPGEWEVEFYADESGREPCREWMGKLTPLKRIALEEAIRLVLVRAGAGCCGDGVRQGARRRAV